MNDASRNRVHVPGPILEAEAIREVIVREGIVKVDRARAETQGSPVILDHQAGWIEILITHIDMAKNIWFNADINTDFRVPNHRLAVVCAGCPNRLRQPVRSPQIVGIQKGDILALRIHNRIVARHSEVAKVRFDRDEVLHVVACDHIACSRITTIQNDDYFNFQSCGLSD